MNFLFAFLAVALGDDNGDPGEFHRGARFVSQTRIDMPGVDAGELILADLNRDRFLDLALVHSDGSFHVVMNLGFSNAILFGPAQSFGAGGFNHHHSLETGDFNNDNNPDFACLRPNGDVAILLGRGNGTFAESSVVSTGSPGTSLTSGDYNSDGATDLAVAHGDRISILFGAGTRVVR